jgi:hypothetical protein
MIDDKVFGFEIWSFGLLSGIAWCSGVLFVSSRLCYGVCCLKLAWIGSDWVRYHGHSVFKFDFGSISKRNNAVL